MAKKVLNPSPPALSLREREKEEVNLLGGKHVGTFKVGKHKAQKSYC